METTDDIRHCVWKECGKLSPVKDPKYHVTVCSTECQKKYYDHKEREEKDPFTVEEDRFRKLWQLHSALTRQVIVEKVKYGKNPDLIVLTRELSENQIDIGDKFVQAYGNAVGSFVSRHLKQLTDTTSELINLALVIQINQKMLPVTRAAILKVDAQALDSWNIDVKIIASHLSEKMNNNNKDPMFKDIVIGLLTTSLCDATLDQILAEVNKDNEASVFAYKEAQREIDQLALYLVRKISDALPPSSTAEAVAAAKMDDRKIPPCTMISRTSGRK